MKQEQCVYCESLFELEHRLALSVGVLPSIYFVSEGWIRKHIEFHQDMIEEYDEEAPLPDRIDTFSSLFPVFPITLRKVPGEKEVIYTFEP